MFQSGGFEVGAFRCRPEHPDFHHAGGPIGDHHVFVFPRTRVFIRPEGGEAFAADPNVVALYNPGQGFRRGRIDPSGDLCEWFAVDNEIAFEAVRALDPTVEDRPRRCFRFSHALSDARTYLAQRELFEALAGEGGRDPLAVQERILLLLDHVVRSVYGGRRSGLRARAEAAGGGGLDAARRACQVLAARFRDPISLGEVAQTAGLSRYRLCRLFRQATGTTMHAYREQLRLRCALDSLACPSVDLTALALDLGYSSHSHFTWSFRRAFGAPPSQVRGRIARCVRDKLPVTGASQR